MIMGVKIRTMWMTPFYLFLGVLVIYFFQSQINLNKLKGFVSVFLILFIFSPFAYAYISITEKDKRTDYSGKEIAKEVQDEWNKIYRNEIRTVIGDEWHGGNLSYHLKTRPNWFHSSVTDINSPNYGKQIEYQVKNNNAEYGWIGVVNFDFKCRGASLVLSSFKLCMIDSFP